MWTKNHAKMKPFVLSTKFLTSLPSKTWHFPFFALSLEDTSFPVQKMKPEEKLPQILTCGSSSSGYSTSHPRGVWTFHNFLLDQTVP